MEIMYFVPLVTTILFFILSFLEEKYIKKEEEINYRIIFRNSILVCITSFLSFLVYDQVLPITNIIPKKNEVFTSKPDF